MAYKITDKCKGCTLCAIGCPQNAITGEKQKQHTVDPDKCIDCGYCGKVCNTGAVQDNNGNTAQKVKKSEWMIPSFDESVCVGCSLCVENCPTDSLEICDAKFHGDINTIAQLKEENNCIDCKICEKVCPVDAISFIDKN